MRQTQSKTVQQVRRRFQQVVNLHDLNFAPHRAFLSSKLWLVKWFLVVVKLEQLRRSNLALTFVILRWIIHSNILVGRWALLRIWPQVQKQKCSEER